jgi:hypothetical protein
MYDSDSSRTFTFRCKRSKRYPAQKITRLFQSMVNQVSKLRAMMLKNSPSKQNALLHASHPINLISFIASDGAPA